MLSQHFEDKTKIHPIVFLSLEEWLEDAIHSFVIFTDHKNLEYLHSAMCLNPRQARWSLFTA